MKKYLISLFSLAIVLLFLKTPSAFASNKIEDCLDLHGTFTSNSNWPGGTVRVSCEGDSGPMCNPSRNPGVTQSADVSPGGTFDLNGCSCPPYASGCLHVDNVPQGCTFTTDIHNYCGTNADNMQADFGLDCSPPPATATPIPASTETPVPASTETPVPASTATPVPGTACGQPCTDTNTCMTFSGGTGGCTACLPTNGNNSNLTCQPSVTTQPTPPAGSCTRNVTACNQNACGIGGGGNCSTCNGGVCFEGVCTSCGPVNGPTSNPTPTIAPPTPTPTPAFNCKCGDISTTAIIPGSQATITGHAQVLGSDRANAMVSTLKLEFAAGGNTSGEILQSATLPASKVNFTTTADVYEAKWNLTIPTSITDGKVYKIFIPSDGIACQSKTAAYTPQVNTAVLGASTSLPTATKPNFFQHVSRFFSSLLNNPTHQSVPALWAAAGTVNNTTGSQQIDTFKFAHVNIQTDANSCKFLQVQYK